MYERKEKNLRILVIGGHPADVFDHCGGTMAHHIQAGDEVTCLALTQGLRVHDVVLVEKFRTGAKADDVEDMEALIEERERIKRQEVVDACACFGITDVRFLSYSDKVLVPNEEMIDKVARVIRDVRPHVVVTHHPYVLGGYQQHATTAQITEHALSLAGTFDFEDPNPAWRVAQTFFMIPCYDETMGSALASQFAPYISYYVDVTDQVENKVRALDCMKSQQYEGSYSRKRTEAHEGGFGHFMGVGYAEAFVPKAPELYHLLEVSDYRLHKANEPEIETRERGSVMIAPFIK